MLSRGDDAPASTPEVSDRITHVLDASALLIFVRREYGWEEVASLLPQAVISTVNFTEVLQRLINLGLPHQDLQSEMEELGLSLLHFVSEHATVAASLYPLTQRHGLGLGDRACLGLAQFLGLPAVTKETSWSILDLPVQIVRVGQTGPQAGGEQRRRRRGRGHTR